MRSRVVTGIAVVTAVAAGGVGGALIGVPGLSGAQPFPKDATTATAAGTDGRRDGCAAIRRCSTPRPRRSSSRPSS